MIKRLGDKLQTFLPYSDFKKTAECLDYKRLGKQRVEAKQIINIIMHIKNGKDPSDIAWGNHPVVYLWYDYLPALIEYYNVIVKEWISRGYKNNMKLIGCPAIVKYPHWFGRKDFHDAHKSNLLRKDKEFYGKYKWKVPDNLPYVWS